MNDPAWNRTVVINRSHGETLEVVLEVGTPVREPSGEWSCAVSATGLFDRLAAQRGVDSFQAGVLAVSLLRTLVHGEIESGATILWLGEPASLEDLFGQ